MNTEWLAIQSFQRNQELLAAINILSIHTKLALAGVRDEQTSTAVKAARDEVASFLTRLEPIVDRAEQTEDSALVGIDPRLGELARSFVTARHNRKRFRSRLLKKAPSDVVSLLDSTDEKEQRRLLEFLSDLRHLIESHAHTDADIVLEAF